MGTSRVPFVAVEQRACLGKGIMSTKIAIDEVFRSLPDRAANFKTRGNWPERAVDVPFPGEFERPEIRQIVSGALGVSDEELKTLLLHPETPRAVTAAVDVSSWLLDFHRMAGLTGISETESFTLSLSLKMISAADIAGPIDQILSEAESFGVEQKVLADYIVKTLAREHTKVGLELVRFECNAALKHGLISGNNLESVIKAYSEISGDIEYQQYVKNKYPLFVDRLTTRSKTCLNSISTLLSRLAEDIELIREEAGVDGEARIFKISPSDGDSHNGGAAVTIIEFDDGVKCVYKPRPVEGELSFQRYLAWLNSLSDSRLFKTVWVIARSSYGWMQFVDSDGMNTDDDARAYFYRYGGLISAVFNVAGTDIHYENLVACGDYPVIVDLETIVQPVEYETGEAEEKRFLLNLDYFAHSPLYTAMVDPAFLNRTLSGSPLAQNDIQDPIVKKLVLDEQGELQLVSRRDVNQCKYLPRVKGEVVDFNNYIGEVLAGYRDISLKIATNRGYLIREGLRDLFGGITVRVILRYTAHYGTYVDALYSPYAMQGLRNSEELLSKLWQVASLSRFSPEVILSEYRDIWNGDIPYFTASVDDTSLFDCRGNRISGILRRSGIDVVADRILETTHESIEDESRLLEYCLYQKVSDRLTGYGSDAPDKDDNEYLPRDWRGLYRLIADRIIVRNGQALFMDPVADRDLSLSQGILGTDFYTGFPGVVFALAYCSLHDREAGFEDKIRKIAEASLLSGGKRQYEIGACKGIGGSIYLAAHLGAIWKDSYYWELAKVLARSVDRLTFHDRHFDIFSGAAGSIISIDSLASVCPGGELEEILDRLVNHLISHACRDGDEIAWMSSIPSSGPTTGFAHGASGIGYALLRAYRRLRTPKIKSIVLGVERFLSSCFQSADERWLESRASGGAPGIEAWCHGAPGIALFYDELAKVIPNPDFKWKADIGIRKTIEFSRFENDSICHGTLGNVDLILSRQNVDEMGAIRQLLSEYEGRPVVCGNDRRHISISMFTGLAGCAYQLLRAEKPGSLPSVATFSAPILGVVS